MSTNDTKTTKTTKTTEATKPATTTARRRRRRPRPVLLASELLRSERVQAQLKPDRAQEPVELQDRLKPDRVQEKLATLPGWELELSSGRIVCERKFVYACLAGAYASYAVQAAKEVKRSLAVVPNDRSVLLIMELRPEEPTGLNHADLALIQALGLGR